MRTIFPFVAAATASLLFAASVPAAAAGCIAGAAVGGVAGHVAGGHGLLGAAAGCAIGRHEANKHERERVRADRRQQAHEQARVAHDSRVDSHRPAGSY